MKRQRILLVLVPCILFLVLAVCVQTAVATPFEGWAYGEAVENMSSSLTVIMKGITYLGGVVTITLFCLILFIVPKTRKIMALPVSIVVISSAVLNLVLKHIFTRSRPDILRLISESGYSFPSGHAMNNAALYTMLLMLIWKYSKSNAVKVILSSFCVLLTVLIGYSRVYLGVHYACDVLGGWMVGFALSMLVYFLWDKKISDDSDTKFCLSGQERDGKLQE